MKKLFLIMCTIMFALSLAAGPAHAQIAYSKDFLEVGNPGGWGTSLKTFEESWTLENIGDSVDVDIWLLMSLRSCLQRLRHLYQADFLFSTGIQQQ